MDAEEHKEKREHKKFEEKKNIENSFYSARFYFIIVLKDFNQPLKLWL